MIEIEKLSKSFGENRVYRDFSLQIEDGKTTCILGKSGSGKSTLLNMMVGLIPFEGNIAGQGRCAYVFQDPRLIPTMTVSQNLAYAAGKQSSQAEIDKMLDAVELSAYKSSYPRALSGGMAQRVSIARAFLVHADTVLFDEPFRALDLGLKERMFSLFQRLKSESGATVLYVTHDPYEALACGDRVLVIQDSTLLLDESNSPTYTVTRHDDVLCQKLIETLVKL